MMRARGFFSTAKTGAYRPRGALLGQETGDSCVAACCRMLLFDYVAGARDDYLVSESFLREALKTDQTGTVVARAPDVLLEHGLIIPYNYRTDLTVEDLRRAVNLFPAIAIVRGGRFGDSHALIVEIMEEMIVSIRDPLPRGRGKAYSVSLDIFLRAWINQDSGCGHAILVLK